MESVREEETLLADTRHRSHRGVSGVRPVEGRSVNHLNIRGHREVELACHAAEKLGEV